MGLSAVYTDTEREIIAALPVREQTFVHALKAMTDGEISSGSIGTLTGGVRLPEDHLGLNSSVQAGGPRPTEYTKPEDIEFGTPIIPNQDAKRPKKRPIYALVWTWKAHKVCKTKARATRSMKAWKRWYERQGWKVVKIEGGYLALKAESRHVVALHEYDAATHRRLA